MAAVRVISRAMLPSVAQNKALKMEGLRYLVISYEAF